MARLRTQLRTAAAVVLASTALMLGAEPSSAFQLLPMSQQFAPTGADATQTFALNNEANEPVAIQIFVVKREVAPDGTETLTPTFSYSRPKSQFLPASRS